MEDLTAYARDALRILKDSLEHYDRGEHFYYRVMAVQLRLLLCDTVRRHDRVMSLALLPRIRTDFSLPALSQADGQLPLAAWLEQPVELRPGERMALRQLIREVCDRQGGAHVDTRRQAAVGVEGAAAEWMRWAALVVLQSAPVEMGWPDES